MTDQEHVPTAQETQLYDAFTEGDHDTIAELQEAAYTADQTPPATKPGEDADVGLTPAQQYDEDYRNAHAHYQADHEAPEDEREEQTEVQVSEENTQAREAEDAEDG